MIRSSDIPASVRSDPRFAQLNPRHQVHGVANGTYVRLEDVTTLRTGQACLMVVYTKTVSESNSHQHWRYRQQRAKKQRQAVGLEMAVARNTIPPLPVIVRLTRCSPRMLDDDNLRGALKHVRDEVAAFYGIDDRDPRIEWEYNQNKHTEICVNIFIRQNPNLKG